MVKIITVNNGDTGLSARNKINTAMAAVSSDATLTGDGNVGTELSVDASQLNAADIKTVYESNADTNAFTDAEKTKLAGVATGATANSTDAFLLSRANHTGTQAISTVTGLQTALDGKVDSLPYTTATDPAQDAAVTQAIVDANAGTVITTTVASNSQTLAAPTDTTSGKSFTVINSDTSTDAILVNGRSLQRGEVATFVWDGNSWGDSPIANAMLAAQSSVLISGCTPSINADPTKFDVSSGVYVIFDASVPTKVVATVVNYAGSTANTVTNLATQDITALAMDKDQNIIQQGTEFEREDLRTYAVIGSLNHVIRTAIVGINRFSVVPSQNLAAALADLAGVFGTVNYNGSFAASANGANLSFNISAGTQFRLMQDPDDYNDQNFIDRLAQEPVSGFIYGWTTTDGGGFKSLTGQNAIIPGSYDDGTAVQADGLPQGSVPNNQFAIHHLYYEASSQVVAVQFGRNTYNSIADAIANEADDLGTSENPSLRGFMKVAYIIVKGNATVLNDPAVARFEKGPFIRGSIGGASDSGTTTMQRSYDNSFAPQVVTDATRGEIQYQQGSGADTDGVIAVLNGAGTATFRIRGDGSISMSAADHTIGVGLGANTLTLGEASSTVNTAGNHTVGGNLTVTGNMTVGGDKIAVDTRVSTSDPLIANNFLEVGAGVTNGFAGFITDRGSLDPFFMGFRESDDLYRVGTFYTDIDYTGTPSFALNEEVEGVTSGATGYVVSDNGSTVRLKVVVGTFTATETIRDVATQTKTATADTVTNVDNTQAVATREDAPTNDGIARWDSATNKFVTGTIFSYDDSNPSFDLLNFGDGGADTRINSQSNSVYQFGAKNTAGGAFFFGATSGATPDGVWSNSGGAERMRLTDAGALGIGVSPSNSLHVRGANNKGLTIDRGDAAVSMDINYVDATTDFEIGTSTSHDFRIKTGGVTRIYTSSSGNIAIGDTVANAKLDVRGEARIYPTSGDANLRLGIGGVEKGKVAADTSGNVFIESNGTRAITFGSSQNVGVNIDVPLERLHVVETVRISRNGDATAYLNTTLTNGNAEYDAYGSINHVWKNAGTEQMRLTSGGDISLGAGTVPAQMFHMRRDQNAETTLQIQNDTAGTTAEARLRVLTDTSGGEFDIQCFSSSYTGTFAGVNRAKLKLLHDNSVTANSNGLMMATTGAVPLYFATSQTERMRIDESGNITIGTAALATTATGGFLYIPTSAGAPTGIPTAKTGRVPLHYDAINNALYIYNGAWRSVTLA